MTALEVHTERCVLEELRQQKLKTGAPNYGAPVLFSSAFNLRKC
jgi:hypothetical protein